MFDAYANGNQRKMKTVFIFAILAIAISVGYVPLGIRDEWKHVVIGNYTLRQSAKYDLGYEVVVPQCIVDVPNKESYPQECCTPYCQQFTKGRQECDVGIFLHDEPGQPCLCNYCQADYSEYDYWNYHNIIYYGNTHIRMGVPHCTEAHPAIADSWCKDHCRGSDRCKQGVCLKDAEGNFNGNCSCSVCPHTHLNGWFHLKPMNLNFTEPTMIDMNDQPYVVNL
uniref:Uncharacterized protein n=1 Tax=Panagrolaimus sp. JU765 TaxID=591449 RepID=A0AC34REH9_9BILA